MHIYIQHTTLYENANSSGSFGICWKWNFPLSLSVCPSVTWSVCRNFFKGWEVTIELLTLLKWHLHARIEALVYFCGKYDCLKFAAGNLFCLSVIECFFFCFFVLHWILSIRGGRKKIEIAKTFDIGLYHQVIWELLSCGHCSSHYSFRRTDRRPQVTVEVALRQIIMHEVL